MESELSPAMEPELEPALEVVVEPYPILACSDRRSSTSIALPCLKMKLVAV